MKRPEQGQTWRPKSRADEWVVADTRPGVVVLSKNDSTKELDVHEFLAGWTFVSAKKRQQRKEYPRCKNCGQETHFRGLCAQRQALGWCEECYDQRERSSHLDHKGNRIWKGDKKPREGGSA